MVSLMQNTSLYFILSGFIYVKIIRQKAMESWHKVHGN